LTNSNEIVPCHWTVVVGHDDANGSLKFFHLHSSTQEHTLLADSFSQKGRTIHRLFHDVAKHVAIIGDKQAACGNPTDAYYATFPSALMKTKETHLLLGANSLT
jgi:hypothetical protein